MAPDPDDRSQPPRLRGDALLKREKCLPLRLIKINYIKYQSLIYVFIVFLILNALAIDAPTRISVIHCNGTPAFSARNIPRPLLHGRGKGTGYCPTDRALVENLTGAPPGSRILRLHRTPGYISRWRLAVKVRLLGTTTYQ